MPIWSPKSLASVPTSAIFVSTCPASVTIIAALRGASA